jgi:hypothetical protein
MNLFALDNMVLNYIKSFFDNGYVQFATLAGLWIVAEILIPTKKVKK